MDKNNKTAVIYHYFEANQNYKDNLTFFLSTAYLKYVDFFIVISEKCSLNLPYQENIKYIYTKNKNNDFGGYIAALKQININLYENFIFINSSVRGPFLPTLYTKDWIYCFLDLLKDDVYLVGSSINILPTNCEFTKILKTIYNYPTPYSHIQTTAYALTSTALKHLIKIGFYNVEETLSKDDVICHYELRLSQEIKKAGWNFKCFLKEYNYIDYRQKHENMNINANCGDPCHKNAFFCRTLHPTELIFIKTERNLISKYNLASHTYSKLLFLQNNDFKEWDEVKKLTSSSLQQLIENIEQKKLSVKRRTLRSLRAFFLKLFSLKKLAKFNEYRKNYFLNK